MYGARVRPADLGNLEDASSKLGMFNCLIEHFKHFREDFWSMRDVNGETIGHLAVRADAIGIIQALQKLLKEGFLSADYWRIVSASGMTIAHIAVMYNRMDLFEFFINNGVAFGFDKALWEALTNKGDTLAHLVVKNHDARNFFLLLRIRQ